MDFLKKFTETASETKTTENKDQSAPSEQSDLFSNAKLVADAARSRFQNDPEGKKYDNAEVAGAAGDLLEAAQTYGKLDKSSGVGSYVEKAHNYLHEYESSNTTKPKTSEEEPPKPSSEEPKSTDEYAPKELVSEETPKPEKKEEEEEEEPEKPSIEKKEEEEGGSEKAAKPTEESSEGGYAKIAEGFLEKKSSEEGGDSAAEGGIGQYAKLAQGFLSKSSDEEGSKDSGAGGNIMKLAGGFLGKK
ncbi:hypothetical protein ACH5RR_035928 [Cinchona calisaya]|uniref:Uncharacterized protein n=1 Tax=Cinchona calisaya TaxID=153742 RepID=A0ABD2Y1P0_9GENT